MCWLANRDLLKVAWVMTVTSVFRVGGLAFMYAEAVILAVISGPVVLSPRAMIKRSMSDDRVCCPVAREPNRTTVAGATAFWTASATLKAWGSGRRLATAALWLRVGGYEALGLLSYCNLVEVVLCWAVFILVPSVGNFSFCYSVVIKWVYATASYRLASSSAQSCPSSNDRQARSRRWILPSGLDHITMPPECTATAFASCRPYPLFILSAAWSWATDAPPIFASQPVARSGRLIRSCWTVIPTVVRCAPISNWSWPFPGRSAVARSPVSGSTMSVCSVRDVTVMRSANSWGSGAMTLFP